MGVEPGEDAGRTPPIAPEPHQLRQSRSSSGSIEGFAPACAAPSQAIGTPGPCRASRPGAARPCLAGAAGDEVVTPEARSNRRPREARVDHHRTPSKCRRLCDRGGEHYRRRLGIARIAALCALARPFRGAADRRQAASVRRSRGASFRRRLVEGEPSPVSRAIGENGVPSPLRYAARPAADHSLRSGWPAFAFDHLCPVHNSGQSVRRRCGRPYEIRRSDADRLALERPRRPESLSRWARALVDGPRTPSSPGAENGWTKMPGHDENARARIACCRAGSRSHACPTASPQRRHALRRRAAAPGAGEQDPAPHRPDRAAGATAVVSRARRRHQYGEGALAKAASISGERNGR